MLALAHVLDHFEVFDAGVLPFHVGHEARNDADHLAAARQRAVRKRSHQPDRAAAVDDAVAGFGKQLAQARGRGVIRRVAHLTRSAINANPHGSS